MFLPVQLLLLASVTSCSASNQQTNIFFSQQNQTSFLNSLDYYEIVAFSGNQIVSLQDNFYLNGRGEWEDYETFLWDYDWSQYNCYSYAIQRFDFIPYFYRSNLSDKLTPVSFRWYEPGMISNTHRPASFTSPSSVACDLVSLGFENVQTLSLSQFDQNNLDNEEEAMAMRFAYDDMGIISDYHFMRYSKKDGYWYHKPGEGSVLRYAYRTLNDTDTQYYWLGEYIANQSVNETTYTYDGEITIFTFEPNKIAPTIGNQEITKTIDAPYNRDKVAWFDVEKSGLISLSVFSNGQGSFEMYDSRWHPFQNYDYNMPFYMQSGRYYMTFEGYEQDVSFEVNAHCHSNLNKRSNECATCGEQIHESAHSVRYFWKSRTKHLVTCECGLDYDEPHTVIRPGLLNQLSSQNSEFINLIGTCIVCGGLAQNQIGDEIDESINYIDNLDELEMFAMENGGVEYEI